MRLMSRFIGLPALLIAFGAEAVSAQECAVRTPPRALGDFGFELQRTASLLGRADWGLGVVSRISSMRVRRVQCLTADTTRAGPGPTQPAYQFELLPAEITGTFNSAYPRDRNNGALWNGRGVSGGVTFGAYARVSVVSAAIAPLAVYSANSAFRIAPSDMGAYGPPFTSQIDLPQRFGDASYDRVDAGASYIRVDAAGLAVGLSNENVWWGPQRVFPLIMGNTASGFPHVFAGTSRAVDIRIGRVQGELLWGRLSESDFFDDDEQNDKRLLGGLTIGFEPRGLHGFTLGFTRAYHKTIPEGGIVFSQFLRAPYTAVRANAPGSDNQLLSVFFRWATAPYGFEVYGEWGRDDHWGNFEDFISEIDHSQAYALGLQRVIERGPEWYRIYGELVHLESALPLRGGRGVVSFYENGSVTQGHTQRGQPLGSATGPGSSAQILGLDRIFDDSEVGVYLERVRYNTDVYYTVMAPRYGGNAHDIELTAAGHFSGMLTGLRVRSDLALSRRWNRSLANLAVNEPNQAEWNIGITLQASWWPLQTRGPVASARR
jgi:Capsule assembly protein Wzi